MRSFDLSPLYRSTVGFDRLFSLMDQMAGENTPQSTYPPYNIEKVSENAYRISVAVAGFAETDLSIEAEENLLVIRGDRKTDAERDAGAFLFRGIAARQFERRFQLADGVSVTAARLENGLLHVDLIREVPEAKKPRVIPIGEPAAKAKAKAKVEQIAA